MTGTSPGAGVRAMVLHRQRLVAEATATSLAALAPDISFEVATTGEEAAQALGRLDVLLADESPLPVRVSWGDRDSPDSALLVTLGSAGRGDPVTQTLVALLAGACAWLPPNASPELLLQALRVALAGEVWVSADLVGRVVGRLLANPRGEPRVPQLSPRERSVLELLAAGHSNQEIAQTLHLSPNTVRTHRQRLFRKIDAHSAVQAAAWLRGARGDVGPEATPVPPSDQPSVATRRGPL